MRAKTAWDGASAKVLRPLKRGADPRPRARQQATLEACAVVQRWTSTTTTSGG